MSLGHWVRCFVLAVSCAGFVACSTENPDPEIDEDLPESIVVPIGAKGGTVKAKGVSVEIPEGALDKEIMISATKLAVDKVSLPREAKDPVSGVYEFGPKGTTFKKEVTVKFVTDKEEPQAKVFFTQQGSDTAFEKLVSVSTDKEVAAKTKHFSLGFAAIPADETSLPDAGDIEMDSGAGAPDGGSIEMDSGAGGNGHVDAGGSQADAGDGIPDSGTQLPETTITVTSVDPWNRPANQTWLAYQDGDGPWQVVSAVPTGNYSFTITSPRYGLAYVCAGAASSGHVLFAAASHTSVNVSQMAYCTGTPPTFVNRSGQLVPPTAQPSGNFRYTHRWYSAADSWSSPTDLGYAFDNIVQGQTTDVVFGIDTGGAPTRINVIRNLNLTAVDFQGQNFDTGGLVPQQHTLTVLNLASASPTISVEYTVNNTATGMKISDAPNVSAGTATVNFGSLPNGVQLLTDRHRFTVVDSVAPYTRSIESYTNADLPVTLSLPSNFDAELTQTGGYERFTPEAAFSDVGAQEYSMFFNHFAMPNAHFFSVRVERDWFPVGETEHAFTFPDLAPLPGFQAAWLPPPSKTMSVSAGMVAIDATSDTTTETSSEVAADLPGNLPP